MMDEVDAQTELAHIFRVFTRAERTPDGPHVVSAWDGQGDIVVGRTGKVIARSSLSFEDAIEQLKSKVPKSWFLPTFEEFESAAAP